jgi:rRNA-processing protein FCF1
MFTDINWNKIINSSSVLLIVCPAVLRELDQKKFSEYDINIRNRSQQVISKMSKMVTSNKIHKIKKNLDLMFISSEPSIDWEKEGLSSQIPDDRIIASILEQKNNFKNIILVSSDIGLTLKVSNKGIKCISLPDEYRLNIKKDKKQKEIEKLRDKITVLENRLPVLKLKILADNEPADFIKITLDQITAPSEDELTEKLEVIKDELKYKPSSNTFEIFIDLLSYPKVEIERYEKDLDKYIEEMLKYYKKEYKFKELQSRLIELNFIIINNGNLPAEDIDIFMHFPDGFVMFSEDELPKKPKEPEKPIPPRTQQEMISNFQKSLIPSFPSPYIPSIITPNINRNLSSGPQIRKTNSYEVKYDLDKLKHGMQIYLKPVYILFESIDLTKSFKISYSILADNLPEPSNGNLNIVIL